MSDATPHHGIPPFILGMTRAQTLVAAGRPDKVEVDDWREFGKSEIWSYSSMQIQVQFDEEVGWRMISITIKGPATTLNGSSLIGCEAEALARKAAEAGIPDVRQTDDFEENGRCHQSELFDLQFWEHEGRVVNFTLFPEYEEGGDAPRWPAA
jgi:hypothetical protein